MSNASVRVFILPIFSPTIDNYLRETVYICREPNVSSVYTSNDLSICNYDKLCVRPVSKSKRKYASTPCAENWRNKKARMNAKKVTRKLSENLFIDKRNSIAATRSHIFMQWMLFESPKVICHALRSCFFLRRTFSAEILFSFGEKKMICVRFSVHTRFLIGFD